MSKKSNVIETSGVVIKELGNNFYRVQVDTPKDYICICYAGGRLKKHKIQILEGDKVTVEFSPYDLTKGRITLRQK
jgi:translation initiation factor IF-1|tara:strand:- start:446 stop:673 length:228 start_codon:yes stop_codon:yes gene_type:complete